MYAGWIVIGQGDPLAGGTFHEIVNNPRAYAYACNAGVTWLQECADCSETTLVVPGGPTFFTPALDPAPWYDSNNPDSWGFLGVVGLEVTGDESSTRQVTVNSAITGGGVLGPPYFGPRTLNVRALAIATDECSLQFGFDWIRSQAVQSDDPCIGDQLTFFDCCPCVCDDDTPGGPCWVETYSQLTGPSGATPLVIDGFEGLAGPLGPSWITPDPGAIEHDETFPMSIADGAAIVLAPTVFPISASGRKFVQADGTPFPYLANTVWNLMRLTQPEVIQVLDSSVADGFNVIQWSTLPINEILLPGDRHDGYGHYPFVGGETPTFPDVLQVGPATSDPASPNYDYWDHIVWIVDAMAARGLVSMMVPAFQGYHGRSWRGYMTAANMTEYGTFLGQLLGDRTNVMWMHGGDSSPVGDVSEVTGPENTGDVVVATNNCANAIIAEASYLPLMTYHDERLNTPADHFYGQPWFTILAAYADRLTWDYVENEVARFPAMPTVMVEAHYEARQETGNPPPHLVRTEMRAQSWWTFLAGGYPTFGNTFLIGWYGYDWENGLNSPGADDHRHLRAVMDDFENELVPDKRTSTGTKLLTAGYGVQSGGTVALSAVREDRTLGACYFQQSRTPITVNLARINKTTVVLSWLNPETGVEVPIGTYGGTGTQNVTYPPGWSDAVLIARGSGNDVVPPGPTALTDFFDGTSAATWIEHDPDNAATFSLVGGALQIAITGTGTYDITGTASNAPMWLQNHSGDFDVLVTTNTAVAGATAPQTFRGLGIIACVAATGDHIKAQTYDTTTLAQRGNFGRRVGTTITNWYNSSPAGGISQPLCLRLRRVGNTYSAFWGPDPYHMTQFGGDQVDAMAITKIGVFATSSGATWSPTFNEFAVDRQPPPDLTGAPQNVGYARSVTLIPGDQYVEADISNTYQPGMPLVSANLHTFANNVDASCWTLYGDFGSDPGQTLTLSAARLNAAGVGTEIWSTVVPYTHQDVTTKIRYECETNGVQRVYLNNILVGGFSDAGPTPTGEQAGFALAWGPEGSSPRAERVEIGTLESTIKPSYLRPRTGTAMSPDLTGLDIISASTLLVKASSPNWDVADETLVARWYGATPERSFLLFIQDGVITFARSTNGTTMVFSPFTGVAETLPTGDPVLLQVRLEPTLGRVSLLTSIDGGDTWSTPSIHNGAVWTSLDNSETPLRIGARDDGTTGVWQGDIYGASMQSGLGLLGQLRWAFDPASYPGEVEQWTDARGRPWVVSAPGAITKPGTGPPCDVDWWPSTYAELINGAPPDDEQWCAWPWRYLDLQTGPPSWSCCVDACVVPYLRQYQNTMITEGPNVISHPKMHSGGAMAEIEFVITAADPQEYALAAAPTVMWASGSVPLDETPTALVAAAHDDPFATPGTVAMMSRRHVHHPPQRELWVRDELGVDPGATYGNLLSGVRPVIRLRTNGHAAGEVRIGLWIGDVRVGGFIVPSMPERSELAIDTARRAVSAQHHHHPSRRVSTSFLRGYDGGPVRWPDLPHGDYRVTVDQVPGAEVPLIVRVLSTPVGSP